MLTAKLLEGEQAFGSGADEEYVGDDGTDAGATGVVGAELLWEIDFFASVAKVGLGGEVVGRSYCKPVEGGGRGVERFLVHICLHFFL